MTQPGKNQKKPSRSLCLGGCLSKPETAFYLLPQSFPTLPEARNIPRSMREAFACELHLGIDVSV